MFAGYDVVRKLSEGASAEVYLAYKSDTQERVILEVMRPELARDDTLRTRFLDATRERKELAHPAVAKRVSGGYTRDGRVWICSEPVGESLRQRISQPGAMSVEELLRIALPICDGLQYLHARGLVHGNLKPASVFLEHVGGQLNVKLIDYGLALLRTKRRDPIPPSTVLVEPEYLAPERVKGQRATARSDIYGLGILLYEALTGFPPFTGPDPMITRRKQLEDAPPPLPPFAARLQPILHKCLAKDPSHRYGSAEAVRMALAALVEGTMPLPGHTGGKAAFGLVSEGDVLGSYKLEKLLGEGAMGQVFLARHQKLGREVALKVLKPELAADRNQVQRFFQEARAVNQVSHPHIVQISDFVDERADDGSRHVYCVMERLEGQTLRERLNAGPMQIEEALRICSQVANALNAAHAVGVVHRDLKPDNLFLTVRDGRTFTKVLDFGIAKLQSAPEITGSYAAVSPDVPLTTHTLAGVVVGTPAYMAPEQAQGEKVDGRADVYALGVVLYRMLSGRIPFVGSDFHLLARDIIHKPPPPLGDTSVSGEPISNELRGVVEMCLEKAPEERFATMADLAAEVDRIRAKLELKRTSPGTSYVATPRKRPLRKLIVGAAALSLMGAVAIPAAVFFKAKPAPSSVTIALTETPKVEKHAERRADAVDEEAAVNKVLDLPPPAPLPETPISLVVNSEPQGAVVFNKSTGEVIGVTPLRTRLPRGDKPVQLHLVGDRGKSGDVTVDARSDFAATVRLRKR